MVTRVHSWSATINVYGQILSVKIKMDEHPHSAMKVKLFSVKLFLYSIKILFFTFPFPSPLFHFNLRTSYF